jgi:hypothetical protein
VLVVFKTHKLEEKQQQKCSGKWICFGCIMVPYGLSSSLRTKKKIDFKRRREEPKIANFEKKIE